ncbi:sulfite exporter TauE/SafE family protein [Afifella sp. IM 167]|uniref:sulfite exporter TauE/SafE family protein n=1 Tax=Afifella sp. IM 167 TaxID=2033586 RepID=UPI001CC9F78D|nr:sulfite exporter TauE/SafE family protein [Afifella sp. IM 167]MBZ8135385.1 hypothetical protein [Afifella sp. IM 167]
MEAFIAVAAEPATLAMLAAVFVAGTLRGFAGFGAGLVFIPVAGALIGPRAAVIVLWAIDSLPTLPILLPALRHADYRSVLPAVLGTAIAIPFGVHVLATLDPVLLRWGMSVVVVVLVILLFSGMRFEGPRRRASAFGVGLIGGVLGGATQLSGPPMVVYWMSGTEAAARIRANLIVFFAFGTVLSGIAFYFNGIFSAESLMRAAIGTPVYFAALMTGQRLFSLASERAFRAVAITLIVMAAIVSLPVFDGMLRPQ